MQESVFKITCRAVIVNEGKLLVVKHRKDDAFFALPGGHLEAGEGVVECVRREIKEELGIDPVIGDLLYVQTFTKGTEPYVEFSFEVKNSADFLKIDGLERTHDYEINEVHWVAPEDDIRILPESFAKDFRNGEVYTGKIKFLN